jgi:ribonuclease BN (tRNA processing enzyme)
MSIDTHRYRPIHAPGGRLGLTVRGSGGPFLTPRRASSCDVVWLDGQPRLLDAGGGVFVRAGQADLDLAALGSS